jgi:secreted PhoX family phosphatase
MRASIPHPSQDGESEIKRNNPQFPCQENRNNRPAVVTVECATGKNLLLAALGVSR